MARSYSHWTPRYIWDRVALEVWLRRHPGRPWLVPGAVRALEQLLKDSDRVFEWGSGRSTRWFAERAAAVTSIETRAEWHERVTADLADLPNATTVLIPVDREGADPAEIARFCASLGTIEPGPVDVVLVDGPFRDHCALHAVPYVNSGGLLIVDDVSRYLPSSVRTPVARSDFASETWREFADRVSGWRRLWFSSGVTDTAIWLSPGEAAEGPRTVG